MGTRELRSRISWTDRLQIMNFLEDKVTPKNAKGYISYKGSWSDEKIGELFGCTTYTVGSIRGKIYGKLDGAAVAKMSREKAARRRAKEEAKAGAANGVAHADATPKGDADARRKAFWAGFNDMKRQLNDLTTHFVEFERRLYRIEKEWFGDKKPEPVPSNLDEAIHKKEG